MLYYAGHGLQLDWRNYMVPVEAKLSSAEDGDVKTGNGLYTQVLLQELKKPTARIEDVFKRVRFQVRQKSHGRQGFPGNPRV